MAARLTPVALLLWLGGEIVVHLIFAAVGVSDTLRLPDGTVRGRAIWLGAQALVAGVAFAVAVLSSLSRVDLAEDRRGRRQTMVAVAPAALAALLVVGAGTTCGLLDAVTTAALSGSLLIGLATGLGITWWRARPHGHSAWMHSAGPEAQARAWGSRGR